jgi:hypothetical protein
MAVSRCGAAIQFFMQIRKAAFSLPDGRGSLQPAVQKSKIAKNAEARGFRQSQRFCNEEIF